MGEPKIEKDQTYEKVFAVYRNYDMTEGRGPMILDSLFFDRKIAADFADQQPGFMGIRKKWSEQEFGAWEIRELKIYETMDEIVSERSKQMRQNVLNKLTKEEKKILNLI